MRRRDASVRHAQVERALLALPNVRGVGLGWKESRGRVTGVVAWRVYVRPKLPPSMLARAHLVPPEIEGLPTDVVPAATGVPMTSADPPGAPLAPGRIVSNLRSLRPGEPVDRNASGLGTLGFFALMNGRRQREVVLVSNRHVLLAHGARLADPVYCPVFTQRDDICVIRGDALDPVAEIAHEGVEGNHQYRYGGEDPETCFIDCASARVLREPDVSTRARAGRLRDDIAVRGVGRMHPLDVVGGRVRRVRKIGGATGVTAGRVVDAAATVECADGGARLRNIAIRGIDGVFVEPGDSGALVLDERDRAVGIVWGRSDADPRVAFACHIHPVLDALGVTMLAGGLA